MSLSQKFAEKLIWVYKKINQTGLLDLYFMRSLYISSYFTYKKYIEDPYLALIRHHKALFKGGNILDIGANVGYTSFVFSKVIESPFKVIAFEPEKRNLEILKQASQKYRFSSKLVSVAAAAGEKDGELELWRNEAHNGDHRILTDTLKMQLQNSIKIQKTPVVTVDSYLINQEILSPVSFIKIDVQGYELPVCKGMVDTLSKNPNIVIGFEYCPSVMEMLGFKPEELLEFFQERGYQFFILNNKNQIQPYDIKQGCIELRQIRPHDYIDILCARRNLATNI